MEKLRLGVIGIGNMGSEHIKNILAGKTPEVALCAVADPRGERRDWAKDNCPESVVVFEDGSSLIQSGLCDAVLIATPHYLHPPLAIEAFSRGLHVLSEKPAGVYTLQVRDMIAAAQRSGRVFGVMFNQRTNCVYRKMKEILSSGEMGQLKRVNWIITDWYRTQYYYDSGAWRATWAGEGGGVLLNQCPHNLDLLQWLCGMPVSVIAKCREGLWHHVEVEDDVSAILTFQGGATGVFVTTTGDMPGTNRLEITLDRGKLVCENDVLTRWQLPQSEEKYRFSAHEAYRKLPCEPEIIQTDGENPQHVAVINAFAANILRGEPLVAKGEEGINALTLSNAMHLSSWLGKEVQIPFDEALFKRLLDERRAHSHLKETGYVTLSTDHTGSGAENAPDNKEL